MASLIFKMAACRPQNRSNRKNKKKALSVLPKGILTPSFIEIALAVTKRALLGYETCLVNGRRRTPRQLTFKTRASPVEPPIACVWPHLPG
jgi:hypothetical protein